MKTGATFIAQIQKLETRKDGSCRLTIDCGSEAIDEIQFIQKIAVKRDLSFQVAFVPIPREMRPVQPEDPGIPVDYHED